MATTTSPVTKVYASEWSGINSHLLAYFFACELNGNPSEKDIDIVVAPIVESSCDFTFGWSSPFENTGADSKAPMLSAMLQSGALKETTEALGGASSLQNILQSEVGKTGITKLNSTQIFTGMQPIKISATLLFRAWKDSKVEVEDPIDKLIGWALPKKLASDGLTVRLMSAGSGIKDMIDAALPSETPQLVGMFYKGRTYAPLVIESVSNPINNLVDKNGNRVEAELVLSLGSLTAWDSTDWKTLKTT